MANISDSSFFKKCQGILQKVKWILEFHELNERETKLFKSAITMVSLDKVKYSRLPNSVEVPRPWPIFINFGFFQGPMALLKRVTHAKLSFYLLSGGF